MKIEKTKQEKITEAKETSKVNFEEITKKVNEFGKLTVTFERDDFKKNLSTNVGWGFQDMKKENRLLITELVKNYNVKFEPVFFECGGFGVKVKIKTQKEQ